MKYFNFLSLALIVGFIGTGAVDTSKKLNASEKQQLAIIRQVESLSKQQKADADFLNEQINRAYLEAAQARLITEKILSSKNNAPNDALHNAAIVSALAQQKKQLDDIASTLLVLRIKAGKTSSTPASSPPPFIPSPRIEIGKDFEKERELRALEGIESELKFQNLYR
jgi:hypothetical protein